MRSSPLAILTLASGCGACGQPAGYDTMELVRVEGAGASPTFEVRALLDGFGLFTEMPDEEAP